MTVRVAPTLRNLTSKLDMDILFYDIMQEMYGIKYFGIFWKTLVYCTWSQCMHFFYVGFESVNYSKLYIWIVPKSSLTVAFSHSSSQPDDRPTICFLNCTNLINISAFQIRSHTTSVDFWIRTMIHCFGICHKQCSNVNILCCSNFSQKVIGISVTAQCSEKVW